MADTQEPTNSVSAVPAVPTVDTPVPVVDTTASTAPSPAVSTEVVAPVVADAAEAKTEAPTPPLAESVLGEAPKVPEVKSIEGIPSEKKTDAKPEADKAVKAETPTEVKSELPVYEEFKVPEGFTLEKEPLNAFTKILGEIETGKLDHIGMQTKGQELIDLAAKSTADSITRLNDYYVQISNDAKKVRFEALKADAEMGGDKLSDTIATLQRTVGEYGGSENQIAEFRKEVSEAGIDASPALCRLIYNMQKKIDTYTKENDGNRIVPGQAPAPSKVKDYQRFYSGSNG